MDTYLIKKKKSASKSYYKVLPLLYLNKSAWANHVVFLRQSHPQHCSNESSLCEAQDMEHVRKYTLTAEALKKCQCRNQMHFSEEHLLAGDRKPKTAVMPLDRIELFLY